MKSNIYYTFGERCGSSSWEWVGEYKTKEEAFKYCLKAMLDKVCAYGKDNVLNDFVIWLHEWTADYDDEGNLISEVRSKSVNEVIPKEVVNNMTSVDWENVMHTKVEAIKTNPKATIDDERVLLEKIKNVEYTDHLTLYQANSLENLLKNIMSHKFKILSGDFIEGSKVEVNIRGTIVSRKVFWSGSAKDLCVVLNGKKYFYNDFVRNEDDD